jgi:DivIVA domain-containing protein
LNTWLLAPVRHNGGVEFNLALRGYDRQQVDMVVERAEKATASSDPALRAAVREQLRAPNFSVVLRGYHRHEVDSFLKAMLAELA